MGYSFKNGWREGVIFVFFDNGKINIEYRPSENGKEEIFFTNGSIEDKDHGSEEDYRVIALKREVNEEFDGKVEISEYNYLGEIKVNAINVIFYVYVINSWKGELPDYTIEDGEKFSRVEWVDLDKVDNVFEYDSAREISALIREFISK